jgi:hypothetical protein
VTTSVAPGTAFLQPTFKRAALIWWAWLWRSVLLGISGSAFIALILGISGLLNGASDRTTQSVAMGLGLIVGIPLGIWAFQMVLEKQFREFTIRLIPKVPPKTGDSQEHPAN